MPRSAEAERGMSVVGQKHRSAITRQSTALTSGNDLRIMRTRGRRAIYCEPMASNIKLEDSIVLRPSIL